MSWRLLLLTIQPKTLLGKATKSQVIWRHYSGWTLCRRPKQGTVEKNKWKTGFFLLVLHRKTRKVFFLNTRYMFFFFLWETTKMLFRGASGSKVWALFESRCLGSFADRLMFMALVLRPHGPTKRWEKHKKQKLKKKTLILKLNLKTRLKSTTQKNSKKLILKPTTQKNLKNSNKT